MRAAQQPISVVSSHPSSPVPLPSSRAPTSYLSPPTFSPRHSRSVSTSLPSAYVCSKCNFAFNTDKLLIKHANEHNLGQYEGVFDSDAFSDLDYAMCELCSCFFKSRGLQQHQRKCPQKANSQLSDFPASPAAFGFGSDSPQPRSAVSTPDFVLPSLHDVFTSRRPTLNFVPTQHRQSWGRVLSAELLRVIENNDVESWTRLFMLPKCILCVPVRGGKRKRGPSISDLCNAWEEGQLGWLWERPTRLPPDSRSSTADSKRIFNAAIAHARHGRLGKACSILSSSGLAPDDDATRSKLCAKHPHASPPALIDSTDEPLQLSSEFDLLSVLSSFSADVGVDGTNFRIQHLLDANEAHLPSPFLPRLRELLNLLLAGRAIPEIQLFLAGAKLTALSKPGGDVRPIAVGNIFRRLTSKCACSLLYSRIRAYFGALQVGVACSGGAEQVIHSMRMAVDQNWLDPDFIIMKVDFSNAFNSVNRQSMLEQCHTHFPDLLPWVQWCYGSQPLLFYDESLAIPSCLGVQQGDPLGPMLFCLVLHPVVVRISELCPSLHLQKWYLDDGSMAGPSLDVLRAFGVISTQGPDLGLNLNLSKCELASSNAANFDFKYHDGGVDLSFPSSLKLRYTSPNFLLLGAPIGDREFCEQHVNSIRDRNSKLLARIAEIGDPQVALHLLRSCASFCKYVYLARTTPPEYVSDVFTRCDADFRDCLSRFAALQLPDHAWSQAQLSLSMGGLGLRSVSRHCAAAFISSHLRSLPDIITSHLRNGMDMFCTLVGDKADDRFDRLLTHGRDQHKLSLKLDRCQWHDLHSAASFVDCIRLNALLGQRTSSWLQAMPSRGPFDLTLSADEMQAALMFRLGVPLAHNGDVCPVCDDHKPLDHLGHHAVTCSTGGFVVVRHNRLRDAMVKLASAAGLAPQKEMGSSFGDPSRPADLLINDWSLGKAGAFDITAVSPLTSENLHGAGDSDVVSKAAAGKHADNDEKCAALGWTCIPIAVDTYGQWCDEAHQAFSQIAMRLSVQTRVSVSKALSSIYHTLSLVLVRQNARAILARRCLSRSVGAREVLQLACSLDRL